MKNRWIISLCMTMMVVSAWAQYDDMYFTPKKKAKKETVKEQVVEVTYVDEDSDEEIYNDNPRNVDEYNRRYNTAEAETYDSTQVEQANHEPSEEYEYSKRILRFSTPSVGIPVSSPLYWDLRYGPNSIYWDVYDDGVYAYVSPSSWNNWYYGWGWSSFYPYWGWRDPWHYGWYDPWYCGYGYGYGYYPYYNPYYYPYYGHHHHYPHYGPGHHPGGSGKPAYRPSTQYRERSSLARGDRNTSNRSNRTTVTSRDNTSRRSNSSATRSNSNSNRNSTPVRSSSGRSTSTPTRSSSYSSGSSYNSGSSRSSYSSPSYSSPSRSGGYSPSRGGGGGSRGGRR